MLYHYTQSFFVALLCIVAAAYAATLCCICLLKKFSRLDIPNDRSSHIAPTPRGGGIAILFTGIIGFIAIDALTKLGIDMIRPYTSAGVPSAMHAVTPAALTLWPVSLSWQLIMLVISFMALILVSWRDDKVGVHPAIRLGLQFLVVLFGMHFLPQTHVLASWGVQSLVEDFFTALFWVGFINAFNFMDGIDGIAGAEAICLSIGFVLVALLGGDISDSASIMSSYGAASSDTVVPAGIITMAWVLAAATAGFLFCNWHPARIFLGDVGSMPLGFLLGFLLLVLARSGYPFAAIILPLYYLADSGITLVRRALQGKRVWEAHREHFYQKAAKAHGRHDVVVIGISIANMGLVLLAIYSARYPIFSLLGAFLLTAVLLRWMMFLQKPVISRS